MRLSRTEAVCLSAAFLFVIAAVCVRFSLFGSQSRVLVSPADRSGEVYSGASSAEETSPRPEGAKININTADAETLSLLPGIGETLAGRIIEYREEKGGFSEISDIISVDGIGQATFERIKSYIIAEDNQ